MSSDQQETEFNKAKALLEKGYYEQSIRLFTQIIESSTDYKNSEDTRITYQTALNNRGSGKCLLGKQRHDRSLIEAGMEDFNESIAAYEDPYSEILSSAKLLLHNAQKELENFDNRPKDNFFKSPYQ